jgi:hypothetical protein
MSWLDDALQEKRRGEQIAQTAKEQKEEREQNRLQRIRAFAEEHGAMVERNLLDIAKAAWGSSFTTRQGKVSSWTISWHAGNGNHYYHLTAGFDGDGKFREFRGVGLGQRCSNWSEEEVQHVLKAYYLAGPTYAEPDSSERGG